jgi:hypothetical protein
MPLEPHFPGQIRTRKLQSINFGISIFGFGFKRDISGHSKGLGDETVDHQFAVDLRKKPNCPLLGLEYVWIDWNPWNVWSLSYVSEAVEQLEPNR